MMRPCTLLYETFLGFIGYCKLAGNKICSLKKFSCNSEKITLDFRLVIEEFEATYALGLYPHISFGASPTVLTLDLDFL